jgi:type IV secretory pathway VirD2 relaxase
MADDDDFTAWLGHVGEDRPFRHQVVRATNQAGRVARSANARGRRFTGARIGRGSAVGRLLATSDRLSGDRARRVVVKARIVRLAGKGARAAAAHLRYLQRDGTTREGERGTLYGADGDAVDGKAFLERGKGDRHQFRFIVSAEDGAEYPDLKPVTRRLMEQMEKDLGTRLEWVAVDHFNTGHPHTHIVLRGVVDTGQNLVIAREYISRGVALRAAEIVNLDLGPRSHQEIVRAARREMDAERFTGVDRRLLRDRNAEGFVSAWHGDPVEQSLRAGRLGTLARLGLAREVGKGLYRVDEELELRLREIGRRGDIIATMHHELRERADITPADYAIFDPEKGGEILGVVVAHGFADEHSDRRYLIVDASDGRSHYLELDGASRGRSDSCRSRRRERRQL